MGTEDAERNTLISTLVGAYGLERLAAAACAGAGAGGRERQLAYCLVVIAQKNGGGGRYGLLLDAEDLEQRLRTAADEVAGHLRDWALVHETIHAEFDRHEFTTVRSYIQPSLADDVIDRSALELAATINAGPRPAEMTLELAREESPASNEYVFQSPLDAWIRLSAKRKSPRETSAYDERRDVRDSESPADLAERTRALNEDLLRDTAVAIAELLETRTLLAELIDRADRFDRDVSRMIPASPPHIELLVRLRATISDESDRLRHEQRALRDMLAYIVLAMRSAEKLQAATILSLRSTAIEPAAVESMTASMHAALADERQPTPMLLARTVAARERGVSRNRGTALSKLREAPERRAELLADVAALLALPPTVTDNGSIAAALQTDAHTIAVNRSAAVKELRAVDHWLGQVFRRYAMGAR